MRPSAAETARRVAAGEISAVEAAEAGLDRIRRDDPSIGAFLAVTAERALEQARTIDARRGRGEPLGPLAGVPVAIKDNLCLEGTPTTCGSRILENYVPPYTATAVRRLLDADAVVVGKTNLDEFAMGSSTENSALGTTRNPWSTDRVPGGSSGGSAAAVAAGMVPVALGSDTGGSVRQPGALCGVAALKPTYGRVSRYGLVAFGSSLDQVGFFGSTAADAALAYGVVAGHDPADSTSYAGDVTPPDAESGVAGRVIAFPESVLDRPGVSADVADATRQAAATFKSLGAEIVPVEFPDLDAGVAAYYLICTAEASSNLARYEGIRYGVRAEADDLQGLYAATRDASLGDEVKRRIMLGTYALSSGYYEAYYGRAMNARRILKARFRGIFASADMILLPTCPTPAFALGEKTGDPLEMYLADIFTVFANLIGAPAMSIPGGYTDDGLPLGVQIVADDFNEHRILAAAAAFESATSFHERVPGGEAR